MKAWGSSLRLSSRQAAIALAVGASAACVAFLVAPGGRWPEAVLLSLALAWASAVDIDRFILPDALTVGLAAAGLVLAISTGWAALADRALGAGAGYLSLIAVAEAYRRLREREGMGRGDAKMFAASGAWVGWMGLPAVLLSASLLGLAWVMVDAVRRKAFQTDRAIPFGPFLAAGFWMVWLLGTMW